MPNLNVETSTFHYTDNGVNNDHELNITSHDGRAYSVVPSSIFFTQKLNLSQKIWNFFASRISELKKWSLFASWIPKLEKWEKITISHENNGQTENKTAYIYASCIPKLTFQPGLKTRKKAPNQYLKEINQKLNSNPIYFSSLNETNVSQEKLEVAFRNKLLQGHCHHPYLEDIFHDALNTASDAMIESPTTRMDIFLEEFESKLVATEKRELIDKDTFKILAGRHVGHGKDTRTPLNIQDPHIKKLIKDFNSGNWKDGEERLLIDQLITENEIGLIRPRVMAILGNDTFKQAMELYFQNLD